MGIRRCELMTAIHTYQSFLKNEIVGRTIGLGSSKPDWGLRHDETSVLILESNWNV